MFVDRLNGGLPSVGSQCSILIEITRFKKGVVYLPYDDYLLTFKQINKHRCSKLTDQFIGIIISIICWPINDFFPSPNQLRHETLILRGRFAMQ